MFGPTAMVPQTPSVEIWTDRPVAGILRAMSLLVYGAYGYTGRLIVEEALRRGLRPLLSGRDRVRLQKLGDETGLDTRPCSLDDDAGLRALLRDAEVVIHAAGPFTVTSRPMGRACLETGTHYVDITGEIPVFEKLAAIDDRARAAGIMMMPGAGFDVVPSDCLAAHLKKRLPTGTRLELAIGSERGSLSRGTIRTMLRGAGIGSFERVDGNLVPSRVGARRREVDFGSGARLVISIPWGDLSTAYSSTGVPNITTYAAYPAAMRALATRLHWIGPLLRTVPVQAALHWGVGAFLPAGPSPGTRATARSLVWGELSDGAGRRVSARFSGPEGYALTAMTSVDVAIRVLRGEGRPGFATPSMVFGPDYALGFEGTVREDLA